MSLEPGISLVFFVYGLAFLVMGLSMLLEASRAPLLVEARLLRPLAVFGILHGIHEWFEFFLRQTSLQNMLISPSISWARMGLLGISFLSLALYGIQASRLKKHETLTKLALPLATLVAYFIVIITSAWVYYRSALLDPLFFTNNIIRYLLAVPAAVIASVGLRRQAKEAQKNQSPHLMTNFNLASLGFGIYGFSQLFVSPLGMFPSNILNSFVLAQITGIRIEVVRSLTAVVTTVGLIRATQSMEQERQKQLQKAQDARLEAVEQRDAMRRELLRHIVEAQEDERARIARELHDETAQVLSAFSLELGTLRNLAGSKPQLTETVDKLQELNKRMSHGLFRLVYDLRPAQLDGLGLVPALNFLREKDCCPKGLDVDLNVTGQQKRLEPLIETVLFRVAQEALNNVSRHAETNDACVSLEFAEDAITMQVQDTGKGFDVSEPLQPPRGWGLAGMRERVEALNGQFKVHSELRKGTKVEVTIPLEEVAHGKHTSDAG